MLISGGNAIENAACSDAAAILSEISAAFGHSFSLPEQTLPRVGEVSDDFIDSCFTCKAAFAANAAKADEMLYDALCMPLRIRVYPSPDGSAYIGKTLAADEETVEDAIRCAVRFCRVNELALTETPPSGNSKILWQASLHQYSAEPLRGRTSATPAQAMTSLVKAPQTLGLMLCPPYAGSIFTAFADSAYPNAGSAFDVVPYDSLGIYAPCVSSNIYALTLALAALLRNSLALEKEAACLEAAAQNMTLNAPSPDYLDADTHAAMLDVLCRQIQCAGELLNGGVPNGMAEA